MKHRIFALILGITLVLSLFSTAFATDDALDADASADALNVAAIGSTTYATLQDAIDNATTGQTITLLRDASGAGIFLENYSDSRGLTIDFGNHTYTVTQLVGSKGYETQAAHLNTAAITLQNGTLKVDVSVKSRAATLIQNYSVLTVKNMTLDGTNLQHPSMQYTLSNNKNKVTFTNCAIIASPLSTAVAVDSAVWGSYDGSEVELKDCTVDGRLEIATYKYTDGTYVKNELIALNNDNVPCMRIEGGTYSDIANAVLAAKNGTTLKLLKNTAADVSVLSDKTLTLDLNGKTLQNVSGHTITNAGTLTIQGNGAVISSVDKKDAVHNTGNVSITGGSYGGTLSAEDDATFSISGGQFSNELQSTWLAEGYYVDAGISGDYPYAITDTAPVTAPIIVKDDLISISIPDSVSLTEGEKLAITSNTRVDGVAEALSSRKSTLLTSLLQNSGSISVEAERFDVEVTVSVNLQSVELEEGEHGKQGLIVFTATPKATVTAVEDGVSTTVVTDAAVANRYLDGAITIKFQLPDDFEPVEIRHISDDGDVEFFLLESLRGANVFTLENGFGVMTLYHFSTFELSSTQTYTEPPASGTTRIPTTALNKERTLPFADVTEKNYFYDAVLWGYQNALVSGTSATTFSPDASCTRAELVTLLYRAAGSPDVSGLKNPFSDVPADAYYHDAVLWAVKEAITNGTSATRFSPDAPVTRAQAVTMLYRFAGRPSVSAKLTFHDVSSDAYYLDALLWAVDSGITEGISGSTFSPSRSCTRAQIVTFLYRLLAD